MSAVEALKAARAVGIELALDGDDLAVNAAMAPLTEVLAALSRHEAEIVALIRPGRDGWLGEDWQVYFDERAGIAKFDGGLPRAVAGGTSLLLLPDQMAEPQSGLLPAWSLSRMRWQRGHLRQAAAHRTGRPCLSAFALLGGMACRAEEGSRCPLLTLGAG